MMQWEHHQAKTDQIQCHQESQVQRDFDLNRQNEGEIVKAYPLVTRKED